MRITFMRFELACCLGFLFFVCFYSFSLGQARFLDVWLFGRLRIPCPYDTIVRASLYPVLPFRLSILFLLYNTYLVAALVACSYMLVS